jgi:glucoamylase
MFLKLLVKALPAALLLIGATATPVADHHKRATLEEFIRTQADISIKGVLANIGSDGSKAQEVPSGIVVASPSRSNPDCQFRNRICSLFTTSNALQTGIRGLVMPP